MNSSFRLSHGQGRTRRVLSILLGFSSAAASSVAGPFECTIDRPLPSVIQSYLIVHLGELARGAYPLADKTWIDGVIAARFPTSDCRFRVYGNRCETGDWWFDSKNGLKTYWDFTSGLQMAGSDNALPGEPAVPDREKPVTIEEGKTIAEAVFDRVRNLMFLGPEMKLGGQSAPNPLLPSSEDRNVWIYTWGASDKLGFGASVSITVRARDGRVVKVRLEPSWQELMGEPKVTKEQAMEKAKALPGRIEEKNLSLTARYWYAERRLVWAYLPPPVPMGGSMNYGIWDAMTGELLESDVLNGGKYHSPYYNRDFYFEPTEANVKANLEKNLKKWAEELDATQRKADAAAPPRREDAKDTQGK